MSCRGGGDVLPPHPTTRPQRPSLSRRAWSWRVLQGLEASPPATFIRPTASATRCSSRGSSWSGSGCRAQPDRRSAYEKLRRRGAVDFPLLSVAASVDVRGGCVKAMTLVISALAARPRWLARAADIAVGLAPASVSRGEIARLAKQSCVPLPNIDGDVLWRREMVEVLVDRALSRLQNRRLDQRRSRFVISVICRRGRTGEKGVGGSPMRHAALASLSLLLVSMTVFGACAGATPTAANATGAASTAATPAAPTATASGSAAPAAPVPGK